MGKNLVIVESPAKSKTIEKYLGTGYKVLSSKGHIRDLATKGKYGLGVDVEGDFTPTYEPIKGKKKDINMLQKEVNNSDKVYLATDPDREGEAISWHLKDALSIDDDKYERVVFNEITKNAVLEAFNHTRKIDDLMVRSQETRRILDRIIGFRLSKLMQSKTGGKSAGRVQSVALKLIVDREKEINSFNPEEYWTIKAIFKDYEANLFGYKDNSKLEIKNEKEANDILDSLSNNYKIESIEKKTKNKSSKPAYITSTMQQDASNKINFSSKKTMSVAQKLYEGINLGSETVGLITYMRTDSTRLSDEFVGSALNYIEESYGKEYVGHIKKSKKTENVQDAHEAIRPTSIYRTPESIKEYLTNDEYKLYRLIYYRALASLMKDAKQELTSIILDNNYYKFKINGNVIIFDGYLKIYSEFEKSEDKLLPTVGKENDIISTDNLESKQHFTEPPARYTESSLIKEMEKLGIGRPSTYSTTMSTIVDRGYVKKEDKKFIPTDIGIETTNKLQEFFSNLINVKYTAKMEDDLDNIAGGSVIWNNMLKEFYTEFEPMVKNAFDNMEKKAPMETGEICPECGKPLVKRNGRYGEFIACSNYPECKYIKKEEKKVIEVCDCIKCGNKIVERKTKKGKIFYGCSNFPKCKEAYWDKPIGKLCPECNNMLVEKNNEIKCSACDYKE